MKSYLFIFKGTYGVSENPVYYFMVQHIPTTVDDGPPTKSADVKYIFIYESTLKEFRDYVDKYVELGYDIRMTTMEEANEHWERANEKYKELIM